MASSDKELYYLSSTAYDHEHNTLFSIYHYQNKIVAVNTVNGMLKQYQFSETGIEKSSSVHFSYCGDPEEIRFKGRYLFVSYINSQRFDTKEKL